MSSILMGAERNWRSRGGYDRRFAESAVERILHDTRVSSLIDSSAWHLTGHGNLRHRRNAVIGCHDNEQIWWTANLFFRRSHQITDGLVGGHGKLFDGWIVG